jgi:cysteine synthase A
MFKERMYMSNCKGEIMDSILDVVGQTPMVRLKRLAPKTGADIAVKLEALNPGGSIKDRTALSMIEEAERLGKLKPGYTIVEPTSGNTGIGLAMVCAVKGYRLILVMPESMSIERRKLLKAYGAEFVLTPPELGMKGAVDKALSLVRSCNNYFLPQQFSNPANSAIHEKTTGKEILMQAGANLDVFVACVGTGGTLTGTARVLKKENPKIKVVAVEPESSAVISGKEPGPHKIQGIGAGFIPEVLDLSIIDEIITVRDENAYEITRRLAKEEGIMAGISSGAAAFAAIQAAKNLEPDQLVVTVFPDSGVRYLSVDGLF